MEDIKIGNQEMGIKEFRNQRVVTFKDIDTVHERPGGTAGRNFRKNKDKFIAGEDYFHRNSSEAKSEHGITAPNGLILITESGYLLLVKSFTDDLSWKVQRDLVSTYFKSKSTHEKEYDAIASVESNPQLKMFKALYDNAVAQDIRIKEAEDRITKIQNRIDAAPTLELPETTQALDSLFKRPVTLYTTTSIGKAFNISARSVNRYLLAQDVHHPYKRGWKLHAKYDNCNYVYQKSGAFYNSEGEKEETLMTWWTVEGRDFVCAILKNAGLKQKQQIKSYDRHANRGKRKKNK